MCSKDSKDEGEGEGRDKGVDRHAAVLFVAGRGDVLGMRPNGAACPSFAKYLARAQEVGVRVLAHGVRWEVDEDTGTAVALSNGPLQVRKALGAGDEFVCKAPPKTPTPTKRRREKTVDGKDKKKVEVPRCRS